MKLKKFMNKVEYFFYIYKFCRKMRRTRINSIRWAFYNAKQYAE